MLIGGFQNIDLEKLQKPFQNQYLELPCDIYGNYNNQVYTNNGRTATIHLLNNCMDLNQEDVILLPDYLCLSVVVSIEAANVAYRFYRINKDFSIDIEDLKSKIDEKVKGIYIIEYFGVPYDQDTVIELNRMRHEHNIPIIEDITQTMLSRDVMRMGFGDYLVGSTRKWLPMTDGGILAVKVDKTMPVVPLEDAYNEASYKQLLISLMRNHYTSNPQLDLSNYLELEKEANKSRYIDLSVRDMTEFSKNIMFASNLGDISERRKENYYYLYHRLEGHPKIKIGSKALDVEGNYVPFGLLLLVDDRDKFYDYLVGKGIIGEIQWLLPYEYYEPGEDAKYLSEHNLMIHCDQRYSLEEMKYVADSILSFFE